MDNMGCVQVPPVVRKGKKKQAKDELDRLKQAEKKKRRLEKALATSAAIRSELEKKKQRKIEEQQRLDEEGAAIAEAVALHVLGEDSDDSCKIMLNNDQGFNPWNQSNLGFYREDGEVILLIRALQSIRLEVLGGLLKLVRQNASGTILESAAIRCHLVHHTLKIEVVEG
ncbi:hypothetical protein MKW92_018993 [Papaver armeniacum]|nr:hypothetical protein MKW92_018993 [Papaver armeniacum]